MQYATVKGKVKATRSSVCFCLEVKGPGLQLDSSSCMSRQTLKGRTYRLRDVCNMGNGVRELSERRRLATTQICLYTSLDLRRSVYLVRGGRVAHGRTCKRSLIGPILWRGRRFGIISASFIFIITAQDFNLDCRNSTGASLQRCALTQGGLRAQA